MVPHECHPFCTSDKWRNGGSKMTGKRNLLVPPEGGVSVGLPPFQRRGHRHRQQWARGRQGPAEQVFGLHVIPCCHACTLLCRDHVTAQRASWHLTLANDGFDRWRKTGMRAGLCTLSGERGETRGRSTGARARQPRVRD